MTDLELSEKAKGAMLARDYDGAIAYLRQMADTGTAIRMELLVIEHEQVWKLWTKLREGM